MTKLDRPFVPDPIDTRTPEQQLIDAIAYEGLTPPATVHLDGKLHRFKSDKNKSKNGWYVAYGDGRPAGHFGCWRRQIDVSWRAEGGPSMTPSEEIAHAKRMAEMRAARDAEMARHHEVIAKVASGKSADIDKAVASARAAFKSGVWSMMAPRARLAVSNRACRRAVTCCSCS
jgi:phage/plasmid primase-like uncharacterized protein